MPSFSTNASIPKAASAVDVPVFKAELDDLDPETRRVAELQNFTGKVGQTMLAGADGSGPLRILVGLGHRDDFDAEALRVAAAEYARAVQHHEAVATTLLESAGDLDRDDAVSAIVEGITLAGYRFTQYKDNGAKLKRVSVVGSGSGLRAALSRAQTIVDAVVLARDLVNEPGGSMLPTVFTGRAKKVAAGSPDLKLTVWNRQRLVKEKMGGVLAVSKGSVNEPQFLTLTYTPKSATGHVALVGKGITFDSGGLSIKSAQGMMTMKIDMAGAATVLAVMSALPEVGIPVKVTAYLPLVENMPGQDAQRPGDVFAARNGKTIEVLNTDAEGRLVLADALSLAAETDADAIIDVATLTGSASVALGPDYAALMATDDDLAGSILAAADACGEHVWRLPLPPAYREQLDSSIADLRNIGTGAYGGTLVAGLFLQEFVGDKPWAHIDVGVSVHTEDNKGWKVKGATGEMVRTLIGTLQRLADSA